MKHKFINRAITLLLALVCVMGLLPLSAFATGLPEAPASITQKSSDYMKIGGKSVRYKAASSVINNVGLPYVFNEQVDVPGYGSTRALCAYQKGTLGPGANGQKWNFKEEVNNASLRVLLTYIYSHTYGDYTDAGNAVGLEHWDQYWSDIWFMVAQAMSWYYEHGIILDVNSNREGFIEQAAEEFIAAMRLYHDTYGQSSFIKDWSKVGTHSIIDSADGGVTGKYTWVFVDEVYLFFKYHYSAQFLYKCWKRFRKYGAAMTAATQNVEECLRSETARLMFANSEFLVLLNQAATDRAELARLLNISETQMGHVTNAEAGHGLLKVGSSIVPFANEFPRGGELYRLRSTTPGDK